jgi:hypothetical protein
MKIERKFSNGRKNHFWTIAQARKEKVAFSLSLCEMRALTIMFIE